MKSGAYTLSLHLLSVLVVVIVILPGAANSSTSPLRWHNNEKVDSRRQTRSACRLFVWDGMSASRYHVCKRLLRDNVYEGLGGKKFVRIRPRSILASLYPLSRHGPDRCLICGQSFRNHLTNRWFPRLYTPYDLYLDDVRNAGASVRGTEADSDDGDGEKVRSVSRRWFGRRGAAVGSRNTVVEPGSTSLAADGRDGPAGSDGGPLAYHRKYVRDVSSNDGEDVRLSEDYEMWLVNQSVRYRVPKRKDGTNFFEAFVLGRTRNVVLWNMDALLRMQYLENKSNGY